MNWKNIKIPTLMRDLPKDKRGFPIPVILLKNKDGSPNFKVNDSRLTDICRKDGLCTICGKKLGSDKWLVGGPESAFNPRGAFNDAPIHSSCGHYALRVCPYMAYTQYKRTKIDTEKLEGVQILIDHTQTDERLEYFVFAKISGFKLSTNPFTQYIIPVKPYLEIEYWKDGLKITADDARGLTKNEALIKFIK